MVVGLNNVIKPSVNLPILNTFESKRKKKEKKILKEKSKINEGIKKINAEISKVIRSNGSVKTLKENNNGKYYENKRKKIYMTEQNTRPKPKYTKNTKHERLNGILHYNVNGKAHRVYRDEKGARYVLRRGPKGTSKHYPFGNKTKFNNKKLVV